MKIAIRAHELPGLLDRAPAGIRILSLDCFDTLIWRRCNAPRDVFADLDMPGGAIEPRRRAEAAARSHARLMHGRNEVAIEDIHRRLRPGADDAAVAESVAAELAAEARHCFSFAPVVALIEAAKARGLNVIIVSDTYLSEPQLRALIASAAGEAVAASIDRIFCSSEYGLGKAEGLFHTVLEALEAAPGSILHVGDNETADQIAPSALGIATAHFRQFDEESAQRLRLESAAASLIDPEVRGPKPAHQPHRPLVSQRAEDEPIWALGHDALGPIFAGFADWIRAEAEAFAAQAGRTPHILFLLRDGHLPMRAFEALHPDCRASAIEISRLTAARSSFVDEEAAREHLVTEVERSRREVIAWQMGFDKNETAKLVRTHEGKPDADFIATLLRPSTVTQTITRSRRFAERLIAHLARAGVKQGDAVMFVDLGYNGTVQNLVEPMLRERMGLTLCGRYLLLREEVPSGLDKRGYFDARAYDYRVVDSLCDSIAVIEQLCTVAQGSTVDYKPDGAPVRGSTGLKGAQNTVRDSAQEGCVAFAQALRGSRGDRAQNAEAWRSAAAAALARLLFLPSPGEVAIFESFDHDVNLGTREMVRMIDADAAAEGLRRRGLFYLHEAGRMFLPGELRPHGLPLNLALLATRRFGLDVTRGDFNGEPLMLPVLLADERGGVPIEIEAWPTHDGYYSAAIPVGAGRFSAAVQWGRVADWVQIEEACFLKVAGFAAEGRKRHEPVPAMTIPDVMEPHGGGLYRCNGDAALMLVPPPAGGGQSPLMLNIVFRPVVRRGASAEARRAA